MVLLHTDDVGYGEASRLHRYSGNDEPTENRKTSMALSRSCGPFTCDAFFKLSFLIGGLVGLNSLPIRLTSRPIRLTLLRSV